VTKRKIANSFGISDLTFLEVVPPAPEFLNEYE
jgi:hypothetical protein